VNVHIKNEGKMKNYLILIKITMKRVELQAKNKLSTQKSEFRSKLYNSIFFIKKLNLKSV